MIFVVFIFCFLHLPGNKGASDTKRVDQTPPYIIKRAGASDTKTARPDTSYIIKKIGASDTKRVDQTPPYIIKRAGLGDGSDVTQTPLLWKNEGQSATIDCSHN
ncbi:uncharacterized protein AKAME5_002939800 [Lates japonicus]|uniref:Uncharacterized protein n=1 Tax=Lates japonicus TaxID=270547 RepID=A0AAD3RFZ3_LATJO|nr:uncharacterized protein AKAME5_002939800 [Lates japonicus]